MYNHQSMNVVLVVSNVMHNRNNASIGPVNAKLDMFAIVVVVVVFLDRVIHHVQIRVISAKMKYVCDHRRPMHTMDTLVNAMSIIDDIRLLAFVVRHRQWMIVQQLWFLFAVIDECASGTHTCSPLAICTDTDESYLCACKQGYIDKSPIPDKQPGRVCTQGSSTALVLIIDMYIAERNECNDGTHNCSTNANCIDLPDGFL
jgi:hypothetical protein